MSRTDLRLAPIPPASNARALIRTLESQAAAYPPSDRPVTHQPSREAGRRTARRRVLTDVVRRLDEVRRYADVENLVSSFSRLITDPSGPQVIDADSFVVGYHEGVHDTTVEVVAELRRAPFNGLDVS